ncbi:bifunctional metallophosphatase/5'-nucleotidase [Neobacillus terrae]|uniref:bifunctional metallophosphatase/5'-nucleotidase n=1 Tax=Neobacillus terrae TaxID=3034837 RepID=UPI001407EF7E|nr:bifunctional UDP-sugar hydrolase/5'-nucleotidase [Neobacillus terrae]NHM33994.1 bifunctional metallophosphatase/5'-nucleotidase [Neobacillus terrae]
MRKVFKRLCAVSTVAVLTGGLFMSTKQTFATDNDRQTGANGKGNSDMVNLQLLSLTDLHGYLQAFNDKSNGEIMTTSGPLKVGGAAYISAHIKQLKQGHENSILFSAGDDFSGWPFEVAAYHNEPTIEFLNKIGLEFSVAGNHEFDAPKQFLTEHMMKGKSFGVRGVDSSFTDSTGKTFKGADYNYLSANIIDAHTGDLVLKPYTIKRIKDGKGGTIPVGFIALTTPTTITGSTSFQEGILTADPLVETANKYAKELQEKGVETIIAVVHEGGSTKSDGYDINGSDSPSGPIFDFAKEASPAIDAIVSGHWHAKFNAVINDPAGNPRPVVEAANHGRLLNELNLTIDRKTKDVVRSMTTSMNHPVTRDIPADPEIEKMVSYWVERGKERWAQPVAKLTGDLTRARNANGESTLADVAADAHYYSGKKAENPAEFALTAASPLRGDLLYKKGTNPEDSDGQILFGEMWQSHGYQNPVLVVSLTGQQIKQILEEQWRKKADGSESFYPLAVSHNVHYSYNKSKPLNDRIDPMNVLINGKPLDLNRTYRVAALAYLVIGADGYPSFTQYREPERAEVDYWAFLNYLKEQKVIVPPVLERVSSLSVSQ